MVELSVTSDQPMFWLKAFEPVAVFLSAQIVTSTSVVCASNAMSVAPMDYVLEGGYEGQEYI